MTAQDAPPFIQSGLNAVFIVGEDTTTAMYNFTYVEPTEAEIRWVLPLPPGGSFIELGTGLLPLLAQFQTEPIIEPPDSWDIRGCSLSSQLEFGDGAWPVPKHFPPDQSSVQIYGSIDETVEFLDEYLFTEVQEAEIRRYAEAGYAFAGLTLTAADVPEENDYWTSINVHLSPTVTVEYSGSDVLFPLGFHANAVAAHLANYDEPGLLPITTYIFAKVAYMPAEIETFQPDLTRIEGAMNQLVNTMQLTSGDPIFFNQLDPAYYRLVLEGIEERNGQAFVVEFIGSPNEVSYSRYYEPTPEDQQALTEFNRLIADYPVLTRLRTFLRPDQSIGDATFVPDLNATTFRMDSTQVLDPAWFYGCTSRKLYNPELEALLPQDRTYIDALHLSVAHPEEWVLSVINDEELPLYVLSPEAVTSDDLHSLESGDSDTPMFVAQLVEEEWGCHIPDPTLHASLNCGNFQLEEIPACNTYTMYLPSRNAMPMADFAITEPITSVHIAVLASAEDCETHRALYEDMIEYAASYQYYLSPELRHTLFVGELYSLIGIGYPEGWIETLDLERNRLLLPEGTAYENSPAVRMYRVLPDDIEMIPTWYDLHEDYDFSLNPITPFEANGRQGYIVFAGYGNGITLIEVSAPTAVFDEYAVLLELIANTAWVKPVNISR